MENQKRLILDDPITRWPHHPMELRSWLEQRPEPVGGDAVDGVGAAVVKGAPEEQFAAAIAVGVDGIDQFHPRSDVEVM